MKLNLTIAVMFLSHVLAGQVAVSFKNAHTMGLSIETLEQRYNNALHSDSSQAVFQGQEEAFLKGYTKLLQDLASFLKRNDFSWEKQTKGFNRIYMNKDGGIDYFLFNFPEGELTKSKEVEFARLVNEFIQEYRFPLQHSVNFAQCGTVRYSDQ